MFKVERSFPGMTVIDFLNPRARVRNSARNLATVRRMVLNTLRLDKSRKGGIKARRMLAGTSDHYREQLLGLAPI